MNYPPYIEDSGEEKTPWADGFKAAYMAIRQCGMHYNPASSFDFPSLKALAAMAWAINGMLKHCEILMPDFDGAYKLANLRKALKDFEQYTWETSRNP